LIREAVSNDERIGTKPLQHRAFAPVLEPSENQPAPASDVRRQR
jgi:hypothetical protein